MVYLLHFDPPYKHAGHYLGSTPDDRLEERFREHCAGRGSKLTAAARAGGSDLVLARTWPGGRQEERRIKGRAGHGSNHSHRRLCPICKAGQENARSA